MAYADFEFYCTLYEDIDKKLFERLLWDAGRLIDSSTTGVDGVKKLKLFFPADPDDADAVKRCTCKLVNAMLQVQEAEKALSQTITESGAHSGKISSISAGNESISYATGAQTATEKAAADPASRKAMYAAIIREGLDGIRDCNGVNLLYMGRYPAGRWSGCTVTP